MFVHVSRCLIYKVHSAFFAVAHSLASLFIVSQSFELVKNFFRSFLNHSISLRHTLRRKLTDYITLICVCQELFSNSFELFKSIFKTRRSLERRCYYTSFSTKVNIKFAVFFHKDHGVPFVRFCHPSTSCVYKKEDALTGVLSDFVSILTLRLQSSRSRRLFSCRPLRTHRRCLRRGRQRTYAPAGSSAGWLLLLSSASC